MSAWASEEGTSPTQGDAGGALGGGSQILVASESPGELVSIQTAEPYSCVSDLVPLKWGLRMYICNKFSGDADTTGPRTTV